jgi:hypothetical protein
MRSERDQRRTHKTSYFNMLAELTMTARPGSPLWKKSAGRAPTRRKNRTAAPGTSLD